jgi:hypothetical protein
MVEFEYELTNVVPESMLTAREMLRVAMEIMAEQMTEISAGDELRLMERPVFEIVRNVLEALEFGKSDLQLCSPRRKREIRAQARRRSRSTPIGLTSPAA